MNLLASMQRHEQIPIFQLNFRIYGLSQKFVGHFVNDMKWVVEDRYIWLDNILKSRAEWVQRGERSQPTTLRESPDT